MWTVNVASCLKFKKMARCLRFSIQIKYLLEYLEELIRLKIYNKTLRQVLKNSVMLQF